MCRCGWFWLVPLVYTIGSASAALLTPTPRAVRTSFGLAGIDFGLPHREETASYRRGGRRLLRACYIPNLHHLAGCRNAPLLLFDTRR
jgi:hypothetical protein